MGPHELEAEEMVGAVLKRWGPRRMLDVGCGCGAYTRTLAAYCPSIFSVDVSRGLTARWRRDPAAGIRYCCMDARQLGFRDASFDLVLDRDSLHHMAHWQRAVEEMVRVSRGFLLLEEPVDDPRSPEKRNTAEARKLLLALQAEVGYPHFPHLSPGDLLGFLSRRSMLIQRRLIRRQGPIAFDDYFSSFHRFAGTSRRERFWRDRLESFRRELGQGSFCQDDTLQILVGPHEGGGGEEARWSRIAGVDEGNSEVSP